VSVGFCATIKFKISTIIDAMMERERERKFDQRRRCERGGGGGNPVESVDRMHYVL
jgi:hypothetical protein